LKSCDSSSESRPKTQLALDTRRVAFTNARREFPHKLPVSILKERPRRGAEADR